METVNPGTSSGAQDTNAQDQNLGTQEPPVDLSATNGNEQSQKDEMESDEPELQKEQQDELAQAPPPTDLSAANGDGQPQKDEVESDEPELQKEQQGDPTQAAPLNQEVEKVDPITDLHSTFHSIKRSMSASHQARLASKISAVISFFEGHYDSDLKKQVEELKEQASLFKEEADQANKRIEFYETQLAEAKAEIEKLQNLNTASVTPDPAK